jgi:thiol:disulfide interchange protein
MVGAARRRVVRLNRLTVHGNCIDGALAYFGSQGNVLFGASVLFAFAFGRGALMILLGSRSA